MPEDNDDFQVTAKILDGVPRKVLERMLNPESGTDLPIPLA